MITSLTKEQRAQIPIYLKNALDVGYSTEPLNRAEAENSVKEIFEFLGFGEPECIFLASPKVCQDESQKLRGTKEFDSQFYSFWYWSNYYNYYLFVRNELFPERKNEFPLLDKFIKWSKSLHYIQRVGNKCLISERPTTLIVNEQGLHHETDKALKYGDGWGLYSINGVRMKGCEFFFDKNLSQSEKAKKIMKVENVEQRSELIRAFGMSNMYDLFESKVIDSYKEYELLLLNVGTNKNEEYLKMVNPSTGEIHIECVGKGVKTVQQALESRIPVALRNKYGYKEALTRT